MTEDVRAVAERQLAQEEEAARDARLRELTAEEERRREAEARERTAEEGRAAAREEAARLAEERRELVERLETAAPGLARLVGEYVQLDGRHRAALRAAGEFVPSGSAKGDVAGYLAAVLGDRVGRVDPWREAGSPGLADRDALVPRG